jgi:hypothetical protein
MGGIEKMIKVEGLPEGFEVTTISINPKETVSQCFNTVEATIHLKKIQPREITLVETDEFRSPRYGEYFRRGMVDSPIEVCLKMEVCAVKIWRIKEER